MDTPIDAYKIKEKKMANKILWKLAFFVLLAWVCVTMATAESNRDIFDSWIGSHYSQLSGNIHGKVSYTSNSVTYDSSWTETKSRYVSALGTTSGGKVLVPRAGPELKPIKYSTSGGLPFILTGTA
ncbi:MAG: hypothetical protein LBK62_02410 [Treponema sp.]|jgi:hypothetical protein|nr:hypothetical protein [Treponema sp.]